MTLLYWLFFKYIEALTRHLLEQGGSPDTPLDERLIAILTKQMRWRSASPLQAARVHVTRARDTGGFRREAVHHWHRPATGSRT
jgi:hypothetical protein